VPRTSLTTIFVLSIIGVILTVAAGYHGWELIATHKVGVSLTPDQERIEPIQKYDRKSHEVNNLNPRTV